MEIIVCIKQVPDTIEVKIDPVTNTLVPYAKPGSTELFRFLAERVSLSNGYLLQNHGPLIATKNLLKEFYGLEELEESAKIAWFLRKEANVFPQCEE